VIKKTEMGRACSTYGGRKEVHTGFSWANLRETPLGRPGRKWHDNIEMNLREIGCGDMDWIGVAQDRDRWRALVNAVMNLRIS
jgi:hypothetical protein